MVGLSRPSGVRSGRSGADGGVERGLGELGRGPLELDGPADAAALERIRELALTLLSNPVIEDFVVRAG